MVMGRVKDVKFVWRKVGGKFRDYYARVLLENVSSIRGSEEIPNQGGELKLTMIDLYGRDKKGRFRKVGSLRERPFSMLFKRAGINLTDMNDLLKKKPKGGGEIPDEYRVLIDGLVYEVKNGKMGKENAAKILLDKLKNDIHVKRYTASDIIRDYVGKVLVGEILAVRIALLRKKDDPNISTYAVEEVLSIRETEAAMSADRWRAGDLNELMSIIREEFPEEDGWFIEYIPDNRKFLDTINVRKRLGTGELFVNIRAPLAVRNFAYWVRLLYNPNIVPDGNPLLLYPIVSTITGKRVYAIRVLHTEGWKENMRNALETIKENTIPSLKYLLLFDQPVLNLLSDSDLNNLIDELDEEVRRKVSLMDMSSATIRSLMSILPEDAQAFLINAILNRPEQKKRMKVAV